MMVRMALLTALGLLLSGAPATTASDVLDSSAACTASAPPCGYIVPQISLDFPNKPACRAETLGGPIDVANCITLPAVGGTHVEEGVMRFSWDISEDGTYPSDPAQPIVITFGGTATNPKWMTLSVEPAEVVLEAQDMVSPDNIQVDQETQQVMFLHEVPLKVTFERTGLGDDAKSVQRIERAQGVAQMFLKAKSSASGQYYKEAFGVEEFRFNPCANDDALTSAVNQCQATAGTSGKDAPAPGLLLAVGTLATVAVGLRRRRA